MKHCKYCNHTELSKQELKIYKKTICYDGITTPEIANLVTTTKQALVILRRLEKKGFVQPLCKKGKSIVWKGLLSCTACSTFGFMSAFNTWSCSRSRGIYSYCNYFKK